MLIIVDKTTLNEKMGQSLCRDGSVSKSSKRSDWIKTLVPTVGRALTWRLVRDLIRQSKPYHFRHVHCASLHPVCEFSYSLESLGNLVRVVVCGRSGQVGRAEVAQEQGQEEIQHLSKGNTDMLNEMGRHKWFGSRYVPQDFQ